ncbi:response regulator transcription factor [Hydrocarboniphaga sp.]|uniref:helix-turn-helix transcriptional regulator n=1 Tax=Hydrocarboniphaga sp. TaxID=2033016 RepID=UPI003D132C44
MATAGASPASSEPADLKVDRYIARLYRSGLAVPPERYRAWALETLARVIPHDGALWGSGSATQGRFYTRTVVGLPEEFPAQLEATLPMNPLFPRIMANLERPVDMASVLSDEEFHRSEIYKQVFQPQGIERILSTGHLETRSGLYSLVTLYRKNPDEPFTDQEKDWQRRITYHLFNAASHVFFVHELHRSDRPPGSGAAVVDSSGLFHEAQPRFLDLLETHYPNPERAQALPFPLPEAGSSGLVGGLGIKCEPLGDLFLLHIWTAGPLDRLTVREREVVNAVAQGLSFKQAAKKIGVAPSTVANHLYRVYRKLGVYSRTELAALVHPAEKKI